MSARSGSFNSSLKLTSFLYCLMRNHIVPGQLEAIVQDIEAYYKDVNGIEYCNGWLARYAEDMANRLVGDSDAEEDVGEA